jgi:hypothetical protein
MTVVEQPLFFFLFASVIVKPLISPYSLSTNLNMPECFTSNQHNSISRKFGDISIVLAF